MFFIHTFSLIKTFKYNTIKSLLKQYKIISNKKSSDLLPVDVIEFTNMGVRINLRKRNEKSIQYDASHDEIEAEIIITPYKLLHNGGAMGRVTNITEYAQAMQLYQNLLIDIKNETTIDFMDAKLNRVDITHDTVTPSKIYTREIIAVLKVKHFPRGFHLMPEEIAIRNKWNPECAVCYENNSNHVKVKAYDKEQNLIDYKQNIDFLNGKGLLRFEITIDRHYMKKNNYYHKNIIKTLNLILKKADILFQEYVVEPLDFGEMFSADILYKYLNCKIKQDKKYEKMCECILKCKINKKAGTELTNSFMDSEKRTRKILTYFRDLNLSPVPLVADCPYIPSVSNLIFSDEIDESKKLSFAKKHTRGKEYWTYEEYK